jgi:transglutaminase-like putative cysteine protease
LKRVLVASAAVAALSVPFVVAGGRPADAADSPATRTFRFDYKVKWTAPEGAKHVDLWVPLPLEDDLQKVADLKVDATVDGKAVEAKVGKDDTYGNRQAYLGVDGGKDIALSWSATITRSADEGQGSGPVLERFKQADKLVPIDGKAAALAKELGADKPDGTVRDRAKKVYDEVLTTMKYDKEAPGWGKGDFDRACEVGKGNCTDFHAKFTGIARASGIPVRFTMGIPLSTDAKGSPGGYHCWAHFRDGDKWVPVDISEAQKINAKDPAKAQWFFGHLDPDRVALQVGRDLTLVPAQKGEPLLFFAYPYAEVDGKKVDLPKEARSFSFENK